MYCIIGNPIKHSLSKYIQNIFIKKFNHKEIYLRFKLFKENFYNKILELVINKFNFNITIPYKESIVKILNYSEKDNISFNTLLYNYNSVLGYNTDKFYFNRKINKTKRKFILIGFGGISKSIINFFLKKKINFHIRCNSINKIKKFSKIINKKIKLNKKKNIKYIYIDCTPCILYNKIPFKTKKKLKLISVNYKNNEIYKKNNFICILKGEELLVIQALQSFKIWNKIYKYNFNRIKKYVLKNFNDKN
ncbi:hypothetical protein ACT2CC_00690 [Candidatus Vidania fulgoroideorum]